MAVTTDTGAIAQFDAGAREAYARALETLGVDWSRLLLIPKTDATAFPEVKKLLDLGLQSKQDTFSADNLSEAGRVFQGVSPSRDGTVLTASEQSPEGVPLTIAVERMEEFSPGLDVDLLALLQATAEMEMEDVAITYGPVTDSLSSLLVGDRQGGRSHHRRYCVIM